MCPLDCVLLHIFHWGLKIVKADDFGPLIHCIENFKIYFNERETERFLKTKRRK